MLLEASTPPPVSGGKLPPAPTRFRTGIIHVTGGGAVSARQRKKNSFDPLLLRKLISPSNLLPFFLSLDLFFFFFFLSFLPSNHNSIINNYLSQWVSLTSFLRLAFPVSPLLVWFSLLVIHIANPVTASQWLTPSSTTGATSLGKITTLFQCYSLPMVSFSSLLEFGCFLVMMKTNWSVFKRRLKTPLQDYKTLRAIAFLISKIQPCLICRLILLCSVA